MQDQVHSLRTRGVAAAYLSSTQRPVVQSAVWEAVRGGRIKLLYVAPERLVQVADSLADGAVSLLAVDEAHCISEWGHDFRPHFRAIGRRRTALGRPPTIGVTATATPMTRRDIVRVLGLHHPVVVLQSFDRPNLQFGVRQVQSERERVHGLAQLVGASPGTAIVYVQTRNRADEIATILRHRGIGALPYHAGLPGRARRALLARFLDGRCRVIVATNAFGMGIDKADVRLVVHAGVPPRPEAYYQEAGRAGRDGRPARCVLLWKHGDFAFNARLTQTGPPGSPVLDSRAERAKQAGLAAMRRYVTTRGCRRRVLLEYLGERTRVPCSGCDRCLPQP
jgi:ATP-dependent DNA helicase RecQ